MSARSARDAVLSQYAKILIRHKARRLAGRSDLRDLDEDDIIQELTTHLIARADAYDPARASPSTFIARVVDSAVATILRDRSRLKRRAGFSARSIDEPVDANEGASVMRDLLTGADTARRTGTDVPEDAPERREEAELVHRACATLAAHLAPVCARLMVGTKPAAVARELGISRRQVRKAITQIRTHLQNAGLGDS